MTMLNITSPQVQENAQELGEVSYEEAQKAAAELQAAETPACSGLPTYLTPESLVAYCDSRLTSLDSQMQTIFNQQQINANTTQAIDQVASDLNDLSPPNGSDIDVTGQQASQIQTDYLKAIATANAQGPTELGSQLQNDLAAFQSQCAGRTIPPGETISWFAASSTLKSGNVSDLSQNLKTYGSNLNSDSQMSMISLQSLMSQQQTAVELSTNLLSTMSQTAQNIASNMKAG